jgi:mono/diheme cytochrome c family protein
MKKAAILSAIIISIFACNSEKKQGFLNTNNIRTQLFQINPAKENLIKGARGGLFTIPAGAFDGTEPVVIELKEIYSPIEILTSGLTTESNGELLESGGMFFINAKRNGDELELKKQIDGSIPAENRNDSMKLFGGEETNSGNVNWVDPQPLTNTPASNEICIEAGKRMFQQNCASCHAVSKQLTGPALAGADRRITRDVYYEIVANPAKAARKYTYFANQVKSYNGVMMSAFPGLTKKDIDCIIEYIKKAEQRPSVQVAADTIKIMGWSEEPINNNPCGYDTVYIDTAFEEIVSNVLTRLDTIPLDTVDLSILSESIIADTAVIYVKESYEFKISTLGWYNIDILMKDLEGSVPVEITATTDFPDKLSVDVRIYMPEKKISLNGSYDDSDKQFYFGNGNEKIPMFKGDKAVVFAISKTDEQLFYSVQEIIIKESQAIYLNFKKTSRYELDKAFQKINLDNINLDRQTKKPVIYPIPCNQPANTIVNK